jgi:hypothetical protein
MITPGLYRHYKGNHYRVYGYAVHTETEEDLVLYYRVESVDKCLVSFKETIWARPEKMFNELVEVEGSRVRRFERIEEDFFIKVDLLPND